MTKRIKFEMTITGFSVKFEGSEEAAQTAQQAITQGLAGLANMQGMLLDADGEEVEPRKLLSSKPAADISDAKEVEAATPAKENAGSPSKGRRAARGEGARGQIRKLIDEGWFDQERETRDVRNELDRRAYKKIETRRISEALNEFLRQGILDRHQESETSPWRYYKKQ